MAGVWKKYDPDAINAYTAACVLIEGGQPRIQVLGDTTVRMVCYGGRGRILPPLYVEGVPKQWINEFISTHHDALEFAMSEGGSETPVLVDLLRGAATKKEKRTATEYAIKHWDADELKDQVPSAVSRWESVKQRLESLLESQFSPKR